jgi:hypothetical protein
MRIQRSQVESTKRQEGVVVPLRVSRLGLFGATAVLQCAESAIFEWAASRIGVPRAKAEFPKHGTGIVLTPEGSSFRISGDRNLLGGRLDGAGGQNRTGYARLFRAALYH